MTAPLCFVDTETDGVHPGRKVWEVAIIRRDDSGERGMSFFVDVDLSTANPVGLNIGRFYDRHPLGRYLSGKEEFYLAPPTDGYLFPLKAAMAVARWTHGAHIVGAVPNFDTETLAKLLYEHGLTPTWHHHLIDIEAMAVGWLSHKANVIRETEPHVNLEPWPPLPWKSDDLSRAIGVEPASEEERHTALGDAHWAMRLYDAIIRDRR